jgi:hypothetical protein
LLVIKSQRFDLKAMSKIYHEQEDVWDSKNDYYSPDNIKLGWIGQKRFDSALKTVFKTNDGYQVVGTKAKTQNQYVNEKGPDSIVKNKKESYRTEFAFEVKTWNSQPKPYGLKTYRKCIKPRFVGLNKHTKKVIVITSLTLLSKNAQLEAEQDNLTIIEAPELLAHDFFSNLRNLYNLAAKIKKALAPFLSHQQKPKVKPNFLYKNTLTKYMLSNQSVNALDNKLPHDTISNRYEIEPSIKAVILENLSLLAIENG